MNLTASLEADKKGGVPGDVVTLTLTLKNTGKVNYTNINVTDPTLGQVFSNLTLDAGKTETYTKEVTITDSADYLFSLDGDGCRWNWKRLPVPAKYPSPR